MMDKARARWILDLVEECKKPYKFLPIEGASEDQLQKLTDVLGITLPKQLEQWLRICNGYTVVPGWLLGATTADSILDIALFQQDWQHWKDHFWIPIAADGSGNPWVLDAADPSDDSVYFVESSEPETLSYVTASSLDRFLVNVLTEEIGPTGWPFDKEQMVRADPALLSCSKAPMPWDD